ncbi:MAG: triose-phosphate isomerase [Gammaproteobacteria bacterium RIFCSPLOWO2_01_FULL_47_190]|nr:MAG: triose-phosphate isomerase [Gammaproteobacteria bacterium RIFCSPLOWO2_01_FULL_47_190]OGT71918.1 MAG: triose-phosphate isomerase [Gammaproteobacteria bacterium RIFCSPLOWO2_12_47_11]OGT87425.1 MAG: triose-phosphate isomerase [Gammaproteobacteria bacterium RIFCSPLOWO2_12_FULL_47_76]
MMSSDRQPLVAANWKMNGSLDTIRPLMGKLIEGIRADVKAEIVICPPFVYLAEVASLLGRSGMVLGAQNLARHDSGAYTGEISAAMLLDYQCRYVIVGHSERRTLYGETDVLVAEKFAQANKAGLTPILCVGEYLEEREAGDTDNVIARQLDAVISKCSIESFDQAVIAYEPVWAIGTGRTATPEQAQEVHAFIRLRLARHDERIADNVRILYGGSVKATNAEELFTMADIDGGLIGGASLDANDFLAICRAA